MNANGKTHQNLSKVQTIGLIIALQLIVLLSSMDETIVAPAMPQLISDLNGLDRFCWVGTAYLLAAVAAMPIVGLLSDRYGRKTLLLFTTGLFIVSSVLCGLAGSLNPFPGDGMSQLIMFRVLQGITGGGLDGLCLAVLNDVFGPVGRVKYMWLLSLSCAVAAIFGPAVGGIITSTLSWRWIFFINLPIGLICMLVLGLSAPVNNSSRAQEKSSDIAGMLALVSSIVFLLLSLNLIVSFGLLSIPVLASIFLGVLSFVLFLWVESRSKTPAIPISILSNPTVLFCVSGQVLTGAYMVAATFFLPLLFTLRLHKTGIEAATLFTPFMLSMVIGSILGGQFLSRIRLCRILGLLGALLAAAGFLLLANMGVTCSSFAVIAYATMVGAGIGARLPLHSLVVQIATPEDISGLVLSLMQAFRDIGGSIGLALASSVMFVASAQGHAQLYSSLHSALHSSNALLDPDHARAASDLVIAGSSNGSPDACTFVFCLCAGLAVLSAVVDMFLPEDFLGVSAGKSQPSAQSGKVTHPHQILTPGQLCSE